MARKKTGRRTTKGTVPGVGRRKRRRAVRAAAVEETAGTGVIPQADAEQAAGDRAARADKMAGKMGPQAPVRTAAGHWARAADKMEPPARATKTSSNWRSRTSKGSRERKKRAGISAALRLMLVQTQAWDKRPVPTRS